MRDATSPGTARTAFPEAHGYFDRIYTPMSSRSKETSSPVGRRTHNAPKGWMGIPTVAKILIVICILGVAMIPLMRRHGPIDTGVPLKTTPDGTADSLDKSVVATGLTLEGVSLDPKTRTLKGSVMNPTSTSYAKVLVSFRVLGGQGTVVGIMEASIPELAANKTATFETNSMPATGKEYELRELVGVPH